MLSKIKYISLISGIVLLILGIYTLMNPMAVIEGMGVIFSLVLLIEGISEILNFISDRSKSQSTWRLLEGIFTVAVAILIMFENPVYFSLGIVMLFGIWLIGISAAKLLMALRLLKYESNIGQRLVFAAIVQLILGIIILIRPLFIGGFISFLFTLALFVQAFTSIFRFFRLNRLERKMK